MNEAVLPVEATPKDESVALRALKNSNLGDEGVTARHDAEAPKYLFGGGRDRLVLPNVVELPKVNGLEVLRRLRDDQRTKVLPLLVPTSVDPPSRVNDRGVGGSTRGPLTPDKVEDSAQRLGLRQQITNGFIDEVSPKYRGPRS